MKWMKCGELEYVSEDGNAYVYYAPGSDWLLDVDGELEVYSFLTSTSAQHAYEHYIRNGGIGGKR